MFLLSKDSVQTYGTPTRHLDPNKFIDLEKISL